MADQRGVRTKIEAITERLGAFTADAQPNRLPADVAYETKRSIVNMIAATLGGSRDVAVENAVKVLGPLSGTRDATLIGRRGRLDCASAAFLNSAAANALDFDDAHLRTVIHPACTVGAAAFAIAERRGATGAELVEAVALGIEIACRLGNAMSPGHYARGFHITTTCGVVGAAAATSKLLGLPAHRVSHALGIAATSAGGLVENLGFMAKSIGVGAAARDGVLAALFASEGIDAAPAAIEGKFGFLHVLADAPSLPAVTDRLGVRWELLANTYKTYPAGVVLNPVLDAALALQAEPGFDVAEVECVVVTGSPLLVQRTDRPHVTTGREAKLSLQHSVAVALARGRAGVEEWLDEAVAEPTVVTLRSRVSGVGDPAFPNDAAKIEILTRSGGTIQMTVTEPRGSLARPLSDDELTAKLCDLARYGCPQLSTAPLAEALWSLDAATSVRSVLELTVPAAE